VIGVASLMAEQEAIATWRKAKAEAERLRLILIARSDELERARDAHHIAHYAQEQAYASLIQTIKEGV
jgi:L-fucose mutarotase/ribose pyranase (RbsD/FucU family)